MLTDEQFRRAQELALSIAGIEMVERHRELLHARCKRLGISGDALNALLAAAEQNDPISTQRLISLLTTKFTGFFRHEAHFTTAAMHARDAVERHGSARLWSCGAATGEEPYSLAMSVIEEFEDENPPVTILATDLDEQALARAQRGEYAENVIGSLQLERRQRFFEVIDKSQRALVAPSVRGLVTFQQLNLIESNWNISGLFDVIFCRNVLMYLETEHRARVLKRIAQLLSPEGLLILDPVENLGMADKLFVAAKPGIYSVRKSSGALFSMKNSASDRGSGDTP